MKKVFTFAARFGQIFGDRDKFIDTLKTSSKPFKRFSKKKSVRFF